MALSREAVEKDLREARELMSSARAFMELARGPLAEGKLVLEFLRRAYVSLSIWTPATLRARRAIRRDRLFDPGCYVRYDPAAAPAPLSHYLAWGWRSGRDPHPLFDTDFYVREN